MNIDPLASILFVLTVASLAVIALFVIVLTA